MLIISISYVTELITKLGSLVFRPPGRSGDKLPSVRAQIRMPKRYVNYQI